MPKTKTKFAYMHSMTVRSNERAIV